MVGVRNVVGDVGGDVDDAFRVSSATAFRDATRRVIAMGDPIKLSESQRKKLLDYLRSETDTAYLYVLQPLQAQREEWNDLYYGRVKPRMQDWMSNFPILLGATFTDAITARIMNTSFAYKPTFTVEPTANSAWTDIADSVEACVDFKVRTEMRLYEACRKAFFETCRLGTGAILAPWIVEEASYPSRHLFWTRNVTRKVKDGIVAQYLPIRDLLYPPGYSDLDVLPWWARRMYWTPMMLRVEDKRGYYDVDDAVFKHEEPFPQFTEEARTRAGEIGYPKRILGWEHWLKYDLKEDGNVRRYVVTWHPATSSILRVEEDTYPRWPLMLFRYGPRDYGMCGLGVIEMTLPFEKALYALYNLLVDNFKVATMQVLKGRKGIPGLTQDDKIYPLKLFLLDNPETDLMAMPLGTSFALNPAILNAVWDLGERRAGVSDYALGCESPIVAGRATATGTLALIQEGQRRFDLTIHDVRTTMDELGNFVLAMMHQRLSPRTAYMLMGERGRWLEQWLTFPAIPPQYAVRLISTMSSAAMNKEVEKSNAMLTFQILGQYYQRLVQLLQMLMAPGVAGTPLGTTLINIAQAASKKCQKVLEAYGELSPGQYTNVIPMAMTEGGQGEQQGIGGGAPEQPGMEGAPGIPTPEEGGTPSAPPDLSSGAGRAT